MKKKIFSSKLIFTQTSWSNSKDIVPQFYVKGSTLYDTNTALTQEKKSGETFSYFQYDHICYAVQESLLMFPH